MDFSDGAVGSPSARPIRPPNDILELTFKLDYGENSTGCFFDSNQIRTTVNSVNVVDASDTSCVVERGKNGAEKVSKLQFFHWK